MGRAGVARGAAALLAVAASAGALAGQSVEAGFAATEWSVAPGGFVGGFERLANGNFALFDGTAVQELSAVDGQVVQTLFTPPSFVFGAFLRRSPDGAKLYFGESSHHEIWEIDLATLQAQVVLTVTFPFDLAFAPTGQAYVTWSPGFFQGSHIALCDFVDGTLDDVVDSPEASGPLWFDAAGDLWTALPDFSSFPPKPDATELIRVAAADLASGIGPGAYDATQAPVIAQLDGAYALVVDDGGDVIVSDATYGTLLSIDPATGAERRLGEAGGFDSFLYLALADTAHGTFEPWQPADAGTVFAIRSDFWSYNALMAIHPARPQIATTPPTPIPPGPFDLAITGGTPGGAGLLFVCAGTASEIALRNRKWPAPLFFDLDFVHLQAFTLLLDGNGEFHETLDNPGLAGLSLAAQFVTGASLAGPFFGTSAAIVVTLQ
ncbi:MAG: hypothetical protein FJ293_15365 [Planctomycetes bacterium]|nr:hypothetical protein [Planctomycetota bacterium]